MDLFVKNYCLTKYDHKPQPRSTSFANRNNNPKPLTSHITLSYSFITVLSSFDIASAIITKETMRLTYPAFPVFSIVLSQCAFHNKNVVSSFTHHYQQKRTLSFATTTKTRMNSSRMSTITTNTIEDYEKMTVKELKDIVRNLNPPKGTMTKLKKKKDVIDYLLLQSSASDEKTNHEHVDNKNDISSSPLTESSVKLQQPEKAQEFPKVLDIFPGAVTNEELFKEIKETFKDIGLKQDDINNLFVATSLSSDVFATSELENGLASTIFSSNNNNNNNNSEKQNTSVISMGGISGFPFSGLNCFDAMAMANKDSSSASSGCFILYGPHINVDSNGVAIGTKSTTDALQCVSSVFKKGDTNYNNILNNDNSFPPPKNPLHLQQWALNNMLMPFAEELENASDDEKLVELPFALYDVYTESIGNTIQEKGSSFSSLVEGPNNYLLAVLGGIQITTPSGYSDYFMALSFNLYDCEKGIVKDRLWE